MTLLRISKLFDPDPDKGDPNHYGSTDPDPKKSVLSLSRIPKLDSLYNKQTIGPAGRLQWHRGVPVLLPGLVIVFLHVYL
jgi:hypothetical protein